MLLVTIQGQLSLLSPKMPFFGNKNQEGDGKGTPDTATPADTPTRNNSNVVPNEAILPEGRVPAIAVILGATASIGGFVFGYESGQISGAQCHLHFVTI